MRHVCSLFCRWSHQLLGKRDVGGSISMRLGTKGPHKPAGSKWKDWEQVTNGPSLESGWGKMKEELVPLVSIHGHPSRTEPTCRAERGPRAVGSPALKLNLLPIRVSSHVWRLGPPLSSPQA